VELCFDAPEVAGKKIFVFEFIERCVVRSVFLLAPGEQLLATVFKVLRNLVNNLRFARRGEFRRSKAAENFRFLFRRFLPR
jgi:hypothetical protein